MRIYFDHNASTPLDPEVARVGLTEHEAVAELGERDVNAYCVEMTEVDRAVIERSDRGFVKLVRAGAVDLSSIGEAGVRLLVDVVKKRKRSAKCKDAKCGNRAEQQD